MGARPQSRVEALLVDLCITYGYCLPPAATDGLVANPPDDPDAFVDAVLRAEGLDPITIDTSVLRELADVVRDWLDDPAGKGARSGLP